MIGKSENRFSLATGAHGVCAKIVLEQGDEMVMQSIASPSSRKAP
jgi:hypothetical protein